MTKTKLIHVVTEQHRIVSLAEQAALESDSNKAYTLLAVASALGNIRASSEGNLTLRVEEETN